MTNVSTVYGHGRNEPNDRTNVAIVHERVLM